MEYLYVQTCITTQRKAEKECLETRKGLLFLKKGQED